MKFGTLNEINDYNNKKAQLSLTNPRNPAKIAPIRRAYNVVADNIGLSFNWNPEKFTQKFKLMEFEVIQGHRYWCQSKAHMWLAISH